MDYTANKQDRVAGMIAAGLTRRDALRSGAQLALVATALGVSSPLLAGPLAILPDREMRLTRRLSRGLANGNAITVTRSWQVAFSAQSRGIAVTGKQLAVSVDAPPGLEKMSAIEASRSTAAMFPILLANDGTIMLTGSGEDAESFAVAMQTARAIINARQLSPDARLQQQQVLLQIEEAGTSLLASLPGDLFYPQTAPRRELQSLTLPGGASGEFEVTWMASAQPGTGLLQRAERDIITRIADTERRSGEVWTMEPL